tara:strand:+ start:1217 stop:1531 length:315 start_codon:yes stop_codon:yes gene_type:complete
MVKDYTTKKTKIKAQVKSRFYYLFWGIATISVVSGQIFVGRGYQQMNESINVLNDILIDRFSLNNRLKLVPIPKGRYEPLIPPPDAIPDNWSRQDNSIIFLNDV